MAPGRLGTLVVGALVTGCGGISASAPPPSAELPAASDETEAPSSSPVLGGVTIEDDGTVTIEASVWPMILDVGDDAIWATVFEATKRTIMRIDTETHQVTTVLDDLPLEQLHGIGVNGSVWVSNWDTSQVVEYDIDTGAELNTLAVGESPIEPVFAFGDVWTLDHHAGSVTRIDTDTSTVAATIEFARAGILRARRTPPYRPCYRSPAGVH